MGGERGHGRGLVLAALAALQFAACGGASSPSHTATPSSPPSTRPAATSTTRRSSTTTSSTVAKVSPPPGSFEVSDRTVTVGNPVTFSGTGCPADQVLIILGAESGAGGPRAEATPTADGSWRVREPIADGTPPGRIEAHAACQARASQAPLFTYAPASVDVLTFRRLRVSPTSPVRVGATLTIEPLGACPGPMQTAS